MRDIATAEPDGDFTVEILLDVPGVVLLARIDWADGAQEYQLSVADNAPEKLKSEAEAMIPHGCNWIEIDPIGDALLGGAQATLYTHYNRRDGEQED